MKGLQVSGGESLVSLINNLLKISYCTLFFVWVFPLWVSHIKFLMRQYRHKTMSYHPFCPKRFLVDDIGTYDTLYSFLYVSFSFWGFSYKVFDEVMLTQSYILYHLVFPTGVFRRCYLKYIDHMIKVLLD